MSGGSATASRGYADEESASRERAAGDAADEAVDARHRLPLRGPGHALLPLHGHALSVRARAAVRAAGAARGGARYRPARGYQRTRPLARPDVAGRLARHT